MNKLKCFFGFHKLKILGFAGYDFSIGIFQCEICGKGFQKIDGFPWLTKSKSKKEMEQYLKNTGIQTKGGSDELGFR